MDLDLWAFEAEPLKLWHGSKRHEKGIMQMSWSVQAVFAHFLLHYIIADSFPS